MFPTALGQSRRIRCLLTGASGNLGRAIQRTGVFELTCATRDTWPDMRAVTKADYDLVIHAAGDLQVRPGIKPTAFVDANVRALAEVLDWVSPLCKPRIFYISSCAVYGNSVSTHELLPLCPVTANGVAKLLSERLLHAFCDEHSMDFVVFRVFNTFGGNDRFSVLSHLRQASLSGRPFVLNNRGRAHRDFVHVDDVAQVISELGWVDKLPRYMNLGTGEATSIADVVDAFMHKFPNLKIEHRDSPESEYSRADTGLLRQYSSHQFRSVLHFIRDMPDTASLTHPGPD
jgi:nucleoside-diphosphate-sugar epimerase